MFAGFLPLLLAPYDLRLDMVTMRSALCGMLSRWRRIGWKNICKLWLEERTPEQLKGEGDH